MRCKSCNTPLKSSEIIWDEERQEHEELCSCCRGLVIREWWEEEIDRLPTSLIVGEDDE